MRLLALICGLWAASPAAAQFTSVRVQIIDVGNADGILIRTPNQQWVLIDAGQGGLLGDSLPTYFGVDTFALVVASHRHRDHIGGMDDVVGRIPVRHFVGELADYAGGKDDDRMRDSLQAHGIAASPGLPDTLEIDEVRFIILPRPPLNPDHENDNSILVRLDYGEFSMLFAGDAEVAERDWLVQHHRNLLDVDVLKASHHGSHNGTSDTWLTAVTPDRVVISAGVHRGFRHPHEEAVIAYEAASRRRVYCTNRHGTVRVYGTREGQVSVYRQRNSEKSCTYDGSWY